MDRTERLLNLVAFFLDAKAPVTLEDVKDAFPDDYTGAAESIQRKFERDKAELADLGVPLVFNNATELHPAGYTVDREAYYLPAPGFTPEELAVLYAAGSAALTSGAFPGRQDLAHALRKVGFFADGPLPAAHVRLELGEVARSEALAEHLEALWTAVNQRKWVDLTYFSPHGQRETQRRVDPWGLALRHGVWNLVGWCHLRQAVRTFHVHRIRALAMNPKQPRAHDYEIAEGFRVEDFVASWPWQHRMHDELEVSVALSGELVALARQLFGVESIELPGRGRGVTVKATWLEGLVTYVLSLGADARVTSPPEAVARSQQLARSILEAHTR